MLWLSVDCRSSWVPYFLSWALLQIWWLCKHYWNWFPQSLQGKHLDTFSWMGSALRAVLSHMRLETMKENEYDQLYGGQEGPLMADAAVSFKAIFFLFFYVWWDFSCLFHGEYCSCICLERVSKALMWKKNNWWQNEKTRLHFKAENATISGLIWWR